MDPRMRSLAANLVHYSCSLKAGEKILIWYTGQYSEALVRMLVKEVYAAEWIL